MLDGKEAVSDVYFKEVRDKIKRSPTEQHMRNLDPKRNFNNQVLALIAENYIIWKEAKRLGFHHRPKFKSRFITSVQGYFAHYMTEKLIAKGVLAKEDTLDREKINAYLIKKYSVEISVRGIKDKEVFEPDQKSPSLELYEPLPKAEFRPYSKFNKKEAEKYNVITYQVPCDNEKSCKNKVVQLNLRYVLDKLGDYDFSKFKTSTPVARHEILKNIVAGDLIPLEFKRLSEGDKHVREFVRRVEQVTLARFYRIVRGIDAASNYVLNEKERSLEPVDLTEKEMRDYYNAHKDEYTRPKTAKDLWICRYKIDEIDRADAFVADLQSLEDDYRITRLNNPDKLPPKELKEKLAKMEKEIAKQKIEMFQKEMDALNGLPSRKDNTVKPSAKLGSVTFKPREPMKRYESIAFSVPMDPFGVKESVLFNSGEGDYVVILVFDAAREAPPFEDPMVQTKLRYTLELKKRKEKLRQLVNKEMKSVIKKENVNFDLLKKL